MNRSKLNVSSAVRVLCLIAIAALVAGCDVSKLTGDDSGSISVYNGSTISRDVLIDGALVTALSPHEKKVLPGYAPGKYLVEIKPCSVAAVTVSAGKTSGLECYG